MDKSSWKVSKDLVQNAFRLKIAKIETWRHIMVVRLVIANNEQGLMGSGYNQSCLISLWVINSLCPHSGQNPCVINGRCSRIMTYIEYLLRVISDKLNRVWSPIMCVALRTSRCWVGAALAVIAWHARRGLEATWQLILTLTNPKVGVALETNHRWLVTNPSPNPNPSPDPNPNPT